MLIKEYLNQSQKNYIISTLLKHYKVKVRVVYRSIKDYAYYKFGNGVLEISNRKGVIKNEKDFLITVLHEIDHAVMADELGTQRFAKNYINQSETVGYNANPYEVQAEKWAQSQFDYWMDVLESY